MKEVGLISVIRYQEERIRREEKAEPLRSGWQFFGGERAPKSSVRSDCATTHITTGGKLGGQGVWAD